MKAVLTMPDPAYVQRRVVNKYLITGIIYLTSENFIIFASVIAFIIEYLGLIMDCSWVMTTGAISFVAGVLPYSVREAVRNSKCPNLD